MLASLNLTGCGSNDDEPIASTTETPATSEDDSATETPSTSEDDSATETPTTSEDDNATETPTTSEDDNATETPTTSEDDNATETPATSEDDNATETPATSEDDNATETPATSEDDNATEKDLYSVQPFLRVAELDGNWTTVGEVATLIAQYIDETDETNLSYGTEGKTFPSNWVVAGEESDVTADVLGVPLSDGNKVKLVELCNKEYAGMAMATGAYHAPALPCEIAVHSDGNKTYVDILDPEAIFSLFFVDAPAEMMEQLQSMPLDVKNQIKTMISSALESKEITTLDIGMGAEISSDEFMNLFTNLKPFLVENLKPEENKTFTQEDINDIAESILHTALIHGQTEYPDLNATTTYYQGKELNLSTYDWVTARHDPLPIPGGTKVFEFCSPTYAKMAMDTGVHHATALPCEVAIVMGENNNSIDVSYLNPTYMFGVLFADAMANMSDEQKTGFGQVTTSIVSDLKAIVNKGISDSGVITSEDTATSEDDNATETPVTSEDTATSEE
jgi:uncharacterized protein (DUF302 family)